MRNFVLLLLILFLFFPAFSSAEDFLGAPVIPQAKVIQKTDARLELKTELSHDETVTFYRKVLKEYQDIKFREWKDATHIEDDGKLAWHSITLSRKDKKGTTVVIVKDNWTWIIGTLVIRYIGVFMVLATLLLAMSISGRIIPRFVNKTKTTKTAG